MNQLCFKCLVLVALAFMAQFLSVALAEDGDSADATETATAKATAFAAEAKEVFRVHCAECHTGDNARSGVEILDHEGLIENEYVVGEKPDDSVVYQLITSTGDDVMPPSNRVALSANEITTIRKWIVAGAVVFPGDVNLESVEPSKPVAEKETKQPQNENPTTLEPTTLEPKTDQPKKDVSKSESNAQPADPGPPLDPAALEAQILTAILKHIRQSTEAERSFMRYFSVRHLVTSGVTQQRIDQHRNALAKTINHLSHQPQLITPTPIDSVAGGTIFAVDIRQLGWHRDAVVGQREEAGLDFFDLALLEYPYAVIPESSDVYDRIVREFLSSADQVRPIPYVRSDWFCSTVLQPPLYHDFLQMPRTITEFEVEIGVDVQTNLDSSIGQRGGMTVSGVSRNNRAVERHPQRNGYYWKSHDFQNNIGGENILADPIDFHPSGGEMIYSLPNGMQAYFVTDAHGTRINAAPTDIVVDKFASDHVVRNGLGCIRCHSRGIKEFNDVVRPVVEVLPGSPGFDKRKVMELYPKRDVWKELVKSDQASFIAAMEKIGMSTKRQEPLTTVSNDFLENTINLSQAASEIGVAEQTLSALCKSKGLIQLGLAPLSAGGVIRRDAFEANFSTAVDALGLGISVAPIDGNLLGRYRADGQPEAVKLRTNKANNFFEPGDRMRVLVDNQSKEKQYIEVFGTSVDGEKVCLTGGQMELAAGDTFEFPPAGEKGIEIRSRVGRETITLFSSGEKFPVGVILSGKNIDDRVVHAGLPSAINKQTIEIETR